MTKCSQFGITAICVYKELKNLLAGVSELLQPLAQIVSLSRNVLLQLLLYGDKDFPDDVNKIILQLTIDFIHKTGRLG